MLDLAMNLCKEPYPAVTRKTLAAGFHELLLSKPDFRFIPKMLDLFESIVEMAESETDLIPVLCSNLDRILTYYLVNVDVSQYVLAMKPLKDKPITIKKTELLEGSELKRMMEDFDESYCSVLVLAA